MALSCPSRANAVTAETVIGAAETLQSLIGPYADAQSQTFAVVKRMAWYWFTSDAAKRAKVPIIPRLQGIGSADPLDPDTGSIDEHIYPNDLPAFAEDDYNSGLTAQELYVKWVRIFASDVISNGNNYKLVVIDSDGAQTYSAYSTDFEYQWQQWFDWFTGQTFDENASITLQCEPYYVPSGGQSYDYGGTHYHFMKAYENDPSKGVYVNFPMTVTLRITNSNVISNLDKFDVFLNVMPTSRNVSRIVLVLKGSYEVVLNESGNNVGKVKSIRATESTRYMSWTYARATFNMTSYNTMTIDYNGNFTAYTAEAGDTIWEAIKVGGFSGWSQTVELPMPPAIDVNPKPTPETDEPVQSPDIEVPDPGEPGQPTVPSLPDPTGDVVTQTDVDLQPVIDAIGVLNANVIKILQQIRRVGQNITSAVYDVYGRIDYWGTHFDTMLAGQLTSIRAEIYSYYASIFGAIQTLQSNILAYLEWIERDIVQANNWLQGIYSKIGGGQGSVPDVTTDRGGFWDALAGLGENIVTDLFGAAEQMTGLATEATRLKDVFPFSALFLVPTLMQAFDVTPAAPSFTWTLPAQGGQSYTLNINLAPYNDVAAIVRTGILAAFVVMLAWETPDMAERMRGLIG